MNKLFFGMPLDRLATSFTGADGTDDVIGFAAIGAFDNVWRGLVGRVNLGAVFLHNRGFAGARIAAALGAAGRIARLGHSKGL